MKEEDINIKIRKIREILSDSKLNDLSRWKKIAVVFAEKYSLRNTVEIWQVEWMEELKKEGYSYEAIAKMMGLGYNTVRFYIADGAKEKQLSANSKYMEKIKNNPKSWRKFLDYQSAYSRRKNEENRKMRDELKKLKKETGIPEKEPIKPGEKATNLRISGDTNPTPKGENKLNENEGNENETRSSENS